MHFKFTNPSFLDFLDTTSTTPVWNHQSFDMMENTIDKKIVLMKYHSFECVDISGCIYRVGHSKFIFVEDTSSFNPKIFEELCLNAKRAVFALNNYKSFLPDKSVSTIVFRAH